MSARLYMVLALGALAGCKGPPGAASIDPDLIEVSSQAELRTSPVGGAPDPAEVKVRLKLGEPIPQGEGQPVTASYVVVDATNHSDHDGYVTLGGVLAGGAQTAPLRLESLFIPAGASRTFLLLDKELQPRPWATGVKVVVKGALVAKFAPPVDITDVSTTQDGDHVVIAATVTNTSAHTGRGIMLGAFHAADGKPLSRGFTVVDLAPSSRQSVRFVGPRGSTTGTIFPGELTFWRVGL